MKNIPHILVVAITLTLALRAEAGPRDGREDAEADFRAGKPKVAWFGTVICMPGHGVDIMDTALLRSLPRGPSYCNINSTTVDQDGEYVMNYNRRMVELIKEEKLRGE